MCYEAGGAHEQENSGKGFRLFKINEMIPRGSRCGKFIVRIGKNGFEIYNLPVCDEERLMISFNGYAIDYFCGFFIVLLVRIENPQGTDEERYVIFNIRYQDMREKRTSPVRSFSSVFHIPA